MQIPQRLNKNSNNKKAQNLIEFMLLLPVVVFVVLVIFEVGLFWQDVNGVYNLNAEINANAALVQNSNMSMGSTCSAASRAYEVLKKKSSMILQNQSFNSTPTIADGQEPFALYEYTSTNTVTSNGTTKPKIALWVDCRNPFEDGVSTQIEFFHKTIVIKASIPRFDKGESIDIIPENIFIASPKLNTLKQY